MMWEHGGAKKPHGNYLTGIKNLFCMAQHFVLSTSKTIVVYEVISLVLDIDGCCWVLLGGGWVLMGGGC